MNGATSFAAINPDFEKIVIGDNAVKKIPRIFEEIKVRIATINKNKVIEIVGEELIVSGENILKKIIRLNFKKIKLSKEIFIQGKNLKINKEFVPSNILLIAKRNRIDVVAVIELEKYLEGVLSSEMPATWPIEALKAQAIASRSYALYQKNRRKNKSFHLFSTVHDQVYQFMKNKRLKRSLTLKIKKAIKETEGLVLVKSSTSQRALEAFYHADCGGMTEEPHTVWRNGVLFGKAKDPYCRSRKRSAWKMNIKESILADLLNRKLFSNEEIKKLGKVSLKSKTSSGRVSKVLFKNEKGISYSLDAHELRMKLGPGKFKSTYFNVKKINDRFIFTGRGFGHGAGLCQWGSRSMAKKGFNYQQILKHYYRKARLKDFNSGEMILAKAF